MGLPEFLNAIERFRQITNSDSLLARTVNSITPDWKLLTGPFDRLVNVDANQPDHNTATVDARKILKAAMERLNKLNTFDLGVEIKNLEATIIDLKNGPFEWLDSLLPANVESFSTAILNYNANRAYASALGVIDTARDISAEIARGLAAVNTIHDLLAARPSFGADESLLTMSFSSEPRFPR